MATTVHLLTIESTREWGNNFSTTAVCGDIVDPHAPHKGYLMAFLTVAEYLTGIPGKDAPIIKVDDVVETSRYVCPKCKNHEDLPLLALKELV